MIVKNKRILILFTLGIVIAFITIRFSVSAGKPSLPVPVKDTIPHQKLKSYNGCDATTNKAELNINNVRTIIMVGGDMWWDLISAKYEIPKGSNKHSLFAGALWIGGIDAGGSLKVAAQTYRQQGVDFFAGPLDTVKATTNKANCNKYDRIWKVSQADVQRFLETGIATTDIMEWPGNGNIANGESQYLAPFYDNNGDGIYDYRDGDFPDYSMASVGNKGSLYGDQTLWWVFNDKGNIHTETSGEAIGLEIRAQAFAYATNNPINDMTFYKYQIINRSSFKLNNTYIGQFVDSEIGNGLDDFAGCDVSRGLGYGYNGNATDDGAMGYGTNPPAVGVDFFQGPFADAHDGIDNNHNGIVDEPGEQILMSEFVAFNNDYNSNGNPTSAKHYYNYLQGLWQNNTPMTYGGTGYLSGGVSCKYMFPGSSDPQGWGTNKIVQQAWSELTAGNKPGDRKFVESAGPFTLLPGAVNYITTGVVWARPTTSAAMASVTLLQQYDDFAQAFFDSNFKMLDGPTSPKVEIIEMNQKIAINFSDPMKTEAYADSVNELINNQQYNSVFTFQGYQIYQLKDATVSSSDLSNPDKARIVYQCDKKDHIGEIINGYKDAITNSISYKQMVDGSNNGLKHSFLVTEDAFASASKTLINNKKYFFLIVPYAYSPLKGLLTPYLAGRQTYKYAAIPHLVEPENYGTSVHSNFGDGVMLTRLEGNGNGGMNVELTPATTATILAEGKTKTPAYKPLAGPVNIKVINPDSLPADSFRITIAPVNSLDLSMGMNWSLSRKGKDNYSETISSQNSSKANYEQLISKWGLSVEVDDNLSISDYPAKGKSYPLISATIDYANKNKPWISGISDIDMNTDAALSPEDWIRSGVNNYDSAKVFQTILNATWAPYNALWQHDFTSETFKYYGGQTTYRYVSYPSWNNWPVDSNSLNNLYSVDLVITSDITKWTRCGVLETCEDKALAVGNAYKLNLRNSASVGKDGLPDNSGTGMGWFPGYAINVETGERLNLLFGEDSYLSKENGGDMIWNPTISTYDANGNILFGGKHYVYIVGHNYNGKYECPAYDEGAFINQQLSIAAGTGSDISKPAIDAKRKVFDNVMWVGMPKLSDARFAFTDPRKIPSDATIKIRIARPYQKDIWANATNNNLNSGYPVYDFGTDAMAVVTNDKPTAKNALDMVRVVPNPYYAYSAYEKNQLDNRVKITNIPTKCTISIYTINGTLIRQFNVDKSALGSDRRITNETDADFSIFQTTSIDWDLKNSSQIPVLGGVYLIHIKADGVGEKLIKWFGVMRPVDLDSF